jgi:hypothetical protein
MTANPENIMIWLQRDALGLQNPAILMHPGAIRFFVFDDSWISEEQPSANRITFINECLGEVQAVSAHGDAVQLIREMCRSGGHSKVITTGTPCRHARASIAALTEFVDVEVIALPQLIADPGPFDLRSFSRFWGQASKSAFGKS